MVPTPRSHHAGSRNNKPWLEIVPETRFIVFNGTEHEANSVKLKGVVRLHTPEAMSILRPKVRLEGKRRIQWWFMAAVSAGEQVCKGVFWNEEQKLGIESAHKIKVCWKNILRLLSWMKAIMGTLAKRELCSY